MLLQSGVLPYRRRDQRVEILLVTSLTRRRWIIPKGHIDPGLASHHAAAREAYEEAGVLGPVHPEPLGSYEHDKPGWTCTVEVFLMQVERELDPWPEAHCRQRRWMPLAEALDAVDEAGLKALLREADVRLSCAAF